MNPYDPIHLNFLYTVKTMIVFEEVMHLYYKTVIYMLTNIQTHVHIHECGRKNVMVIGIV
jgi:hypothetical protein